MGREGIEKLMGEGSQERNDGRTAVTGLRSVWQWALKVMELMG